jgi:Schlafen, AlbA_2
VHRGTEANSQTNPAVTDHNQHASFATLQELSVEPEGERLEFMEARGGFHFEKLPKYCAALSNEGGGSIVFGVTDRRPRRVVGTNAFEEPGRTVAGLSDRLPCTISHDGVRGLRLHPGYPDEMSVQRVCPAVLLSVPHGVAIGSYLELRCASNPRNRLKGLLKRI